MADSAPPDDSGFLTSFRVDRSAPVANDFARQLLALNPSLVLELDLQNAIIIEANPAAQTMFGSGQRPLVGR